MADYLMGMDFGTGGAKACIINASGDVLGFSFREYELIHENPGWSEHEASEYWPTACKLIKDALSESGVNPTELRGIAVSSALPSMVMVDSDGNPIHRAYNLMDKRAMKEVKWLKENVGDDRIFDLSAYRLEDHPSLVNVLWEKNNRPDSFKKIYKVLTIDGYIAMKLCGKATLHYSGAAFYGVAYDMRRRKFDEKLMEELDLDMSILPDLYNCDDIVGEVTEKAAAECGLYPGTKVAGGQVDCNASWLGAGAIEVGDFQSNLGTVGNFGIIHKNMEYNFSDVGRLMINFPYTVDSENTFVTVPTTTTGGQSLRYIRDNYSSTEIETERVLGISSYELLTMQAAKVPIGSDGLLTLPFMMGERTPIWDPLARGVIFGLSLNHGKGHLVRSMMEAVAFAMYDSFRLIKEAGLSINYPMVLNEGGAVSGLWRKIIADVFNVPIVLVKRRTGAPFGDALLAGVASGVFSDYSVAKDWAEYVEPMEPERENHERYMEYFSLYKKLYKHVKDDFRDLAELRDKKA